MAIIPQMRLFSWKEIDELGDLDRLRLVLEYMPNEELMQTLERKRGKAVMTTQCVRCGTRYWRASCSNMTTWRNADESSPAMAN